ncbi:hypothetical protein BTS2_2713 [Bacillus sp. TS-2]|nr:hypothetical protein BTS2_2713 [Bacillus sp. TS-2]
MFKLPKKKYYLNRNKQELTFPQRLFISFILFIGLTFLSFIIVEKSIRPTIEEIALMETQKIGTSVINFAVTETLKDVDMNNVHEVLYDENGKVQSYNFNPQLYNQILSKTITNAQTYIAMMEADEIPNMQFVNRDNNDSVPEIGLLYSIPLGHATGNAFLANLGPKIPIELTAIADVDIDFRKDVQTTGINNTMIIIALDLKVNAKIIIPFTTLENPVVTTIPFAMTFIPGEVPQYYSGSGGGGMIPALPSPSNEQNGEELENFTPNDLLPNDTN